MLLHIFMSNSDKKNKAIFVLKQNYKFLEPILVLKGDLLDYVKWWTLDIVQKISFRN